MQKHRLADEEERTKLRRENPRSINVNYKPTTRQKENVSKVRLALTTASNSLTLRTKDWKTCQTNA